FAFGVVRIAIFGLDVSVVGDGEFRAGTRAPAVHIDIGFDVGRVVGGQHVIAGIGVAALHIEQRPRRKQHAGARADIEVTPGLDIAYTETGEAGGVELGLGVGFHPFAFDADHRAAGGEIVTDAHAIGDVVDRLVDL